MCNGGALASVGLYWVDHMSLTGLAHWLKAETGLAMGVGKVRPCPLGAMPWFPGRSGDSAVLLI